MTRINETNLSNEERNKVSEGTFQYYYDRNMKLGKENDLIMKKEWWQQFIM